MLGTAEYGPLNQEIVLMHSPEICPNNASVIEKYFAYCINHRMDLLADLFTEDTILHTFGGTEIDAIWEGRADVVTGLNLLFVALTTKVWCILTQLLRKFGTVRCLCLMEGLYRT